MSHIQPTPIVVITTEIRPVDLKHSIPYSVNICRTKNMALSKNVSWANTPKELKQASQWVMLFCAHCEKDRINSMCWKRCAKKRFWRNNGFIEKFQLVYCALLNLVWPWWLSDLSLQINPRARLLIHLIFGLAEAKGREIQHTLTFLPLSGNEIA